MNIRQLRNSYHNERSFEIESLGEIVGVGHTYIDRFVGMKKTSIFYFIFSVCVSLFLT